MKFSTFLESKYGKGTYARMDFAPISVLAIDTFIRDNGVPNPVPHDKLHVTLLYSRKPMPGYTSQGSLEFPQKVRVSGYDIWDTRDGKKALVATLHSPQLVERHKRLMAEFGGSYDFPNYKPHFTMSYDVGPEFSALMLPPFPVSLYLWYEHAEELNTEWKP